MNNNLYRLIVDFQENVQVALKLMHRSGIKCHQVAMGGLNLIYPMLVS